MSDILSAREMAICLWTIIVILVVFVVLVRSSGCRTIADPVASLLTPKLAIPFLLVFAWCGLMVWLLHIIGYWEASMTLDTLAFVFVCAAASVVRASTATYDRTFFLSTVLKNVELAALLGLLLSSYTLSFWLEFAVIVPVTSAIALAHSISRVRPEWATIQRLTGVPLAIIGFAMLAYCVWRVVNEYRDFATLTTLKTAFLPLALSAMFMPFLYFACVWLAYDSLFCHMRIWGPRDNRLRRYCCWRLMLKHTCLARRVQTDGRADATRLRPAADRTEVRRILAE